MKCKCPDLFCKHRTTMAEQECVYDEHYGEILTRANANLMYKTLDWQSFRRETAKDILCALVNNNDGYHGDGENGMFAVQAISLADELIRRLREEKQ